MEWVLFGGSVLLKLVITYLHANTADSKKTLNTTTTMWAREEGGSQSGVMEVNLERAPCASAEKWAEPLKQWTQSSDEEEEGEEGEEEEEGEWGEDSCF